MQEIHRIRERLLKSVSGFTDEQLNKRVGEGTWSIMENLEHLYLIERLVVQSITKELKNPSSTTTEKKPIHYTVNRSTKVKAPSVLEPSSQFLSFEDIHQKLIESRISLVALKEQVSDEILEQKSFQHPIFGLLSLKQWVEFIGYHEARHLEQIEEIKQHLKMIS
ncbi:DinB family protein [Bacillus pinisoli]|uniref:DinB family protein n=1 Tax=Bacillus pinisoli TaxID=2901866 RepID=UPI001FF6C891|nr:DinB family protein [Bacillus pinisoli]